jgi:hypothetical protein
MPRNLAILSIVLCLALPVHAHDIRPAYLDVIEAPAGEVHIVWREPVAGLYAVALTPGISTGWLRREPYSSERSETMLVREWRVTEPHDELLGTTVSIEGLERTITDVLLHIRYRDGSEQTELLTPSAPTTRIKGTAKTAVPVKEYLLLGFSHIWGGIDHLLYVFGLTLLVRDFRALLKTITGFTLAHSTTLAASALGFVHVPAAPVEASIALSIMYVAAEALNAVHGRASFAQRAPWAIAFVFGLLHGLGFAGALAEVGLPAHHIPLALLLFNAGIEIGQISFVLCLLCAAQLLRRSVPRWVERFRWAPPYVIGGLASLWFIQRLAAIF